MLFLSLVLGFCKVMISSFWCVNIFTLVTILAGLAHHLIILEIDLIFRQNIRLRCLMSFIRIAYYVGQVTAIFTAQKSVCFCDS